jgi:hypothetical protein
MPTSPTVAMPAASTGSEPAFSEQEDGSSAGPPSSIVSIPTSAVHRLVAGQAVTDLASAVKELVDNAIDAGATSINSESRIIVSPKICLTSAKSEKYLYLWLHIMIHHVNV